MKGWLTHHPRARALTTALVLGIACAGLVILLQHTRIVRTWELKTYDWRMNMLEEIADPSIALVYVDEGSLRHMESMGVGWPWPRELYASLLNFLARGGAKAAFFDLFFSEDSVYGVTDDDAFAHGMDAGVPVYLALFATKHPGPEDPRIGEALAKMALPLAGAAPQDLPRAATFGSLPIATLMNSAHSFGNVQSRPDPDGVYRRIPPAWVFDNTVVPSIALKLASDGMRADAVSWSDGLTVGDTSVPLDRNGNMLLRYPGTLAAFPTYSMAELLVAEQQIVDGEQPRVSPDVFRDSTVVIGLSAPGLYDIKASPLSSVTPGAFIHATALSNLLTGRAMAPTGTWPSALLVIAIACAVSLILSSLKRGGGIALLIMGMAAAVVIASVLLFKAGRWVPLVPPIMAILLTSTSTLAKNFITEGRTKRAIKNAFGQYLSKEVVDQIARDPEHARLGGARKELTILFSDIANFTTISEDMQPEELVGELNHYLSTLTRIIIDERGTLDKYIGDAIMAFWGAPVELADHARRATTAALSMQKELVRFPTFVTRIGIHTGEVVVGNIGSDLRFNYTVMGDAVNLASRLEGLNKHFGTRVLISATTRASLGSDCRCRRVGRVRVKGRAEPIEIYEPFGFGVELSETQKQAHALFDNAIDFFNQGHYDKAHSLFARATRTADDPVARFYQGVCIKLRGNDAPRPVDGVIDFETK